ncbi:MAG: LysR family transcriptional regulator [Rhodoferax sp.]|nr:LysR family transcriptional regulator [Rhodoferax sp.]
METIDHFDLRSFDLNLLVAFDALMQDRSVTKAAARLRIQQPAMSHNLSVLRMLLEDELFVRVGHAMQPTTKALALSTQIRQLLGQAQALIRASDRFEPEGAQRTFRVGLVCGEMLMPLLSADLLGYGAGLKVIAQRISSDGFGADLDRHSVDLVVGCFAPEEARYRAVHLLDHEMVCCYQPQRMPWRGPIQKAQFLDASHVAIAQTHDLHAQICNALLHEGRALQVTAVVPDCMTALVTVANAPVVATLPRSVAQLFASQFGLVVDPLPLDLGPLPVSMVWSAHTDADPALGWLRQRIVALMGVPRNRALAQQVETELAY